MKRQSAKRLGAILLLASLMLMTSAVFSYGEDFTIENTSPKDGATGMALDNMGVKVFFSEDVYSKENQEANANLCKLTGPKGKEIPTRVVFNKDDPKVMLVLADTADKDLKVEGKTKYTLTIEEGFVSAAGHELTLDENSEIYAVDKGDCTVTFETLNPRSSMWISMGMMAAMIGGMVFFSTRESKKAAAEAKGGKKNAYEPVNPYKEAKRTGKSVEEIVAQENKKKEKIAEKEAKKARQEKENKKEISDDNLRVAGPRPISAAGSTYKAPKK